MHRITKHYFVSSKSISKTQDTCFYSFGVKMQDITLPGLDFEKFNGILTFFIRICYRKSFTESNSDFLTVGKNPKHANSLGKAWWITRIKVTMNFVTFNASTIFFLTKRKRYYKIPNWKRKRYCTIPCWKRSWEEMKL